MRTHGHNSPRSPTFQSWHGGKQRCLNSNAKAYSNYGGRGIRWCERWMVFENFLADMGERPEGTTLERIDNDGDYEPGNCRWATWTEQVLNKRRHGGAKLTAEQVTEIRAVPRSPNVCHRLAEKYSVSWHTIKKIRQRLTWKQAAYQQNIT